MSKEFLDRSSWVVVELASGEERRMGAAITTREWCVDIDNRGNEYTVTVIGQTAADDRQEIVVAGEVRCRVCLSGKELLLYNDHSTAVTTKYAFP